MARAFIVAALAALCLTRHAQAARSHANLTNMDGEDAHREGDADGVDRTDDAGLGCSNFCVQCRDGSSVWYGRHKNWWKSGASLTLGGVGIAAAASGVGVVGVAMAGGAGAVVGVGVGAKTSEETHTHWTGNLPTTGFFCERIDVLKFDRNNQCKATALMEQSKKRFGRVRNNFLKPYGEDGELMTQQGYTEVDMTSYKTGCKVVKAAGMSGSWNQFKSNFQSECTSATNKGIFACSMHSKLCGPGGVVGTTHAATADQCMNECQTGNQQSRCALN